MPKVWKDAYFYLDGTAWDECSDTADPSWDGYPGCHLTNNPWGWQICTAFGYGQNMRFLQNSSKGLQWSEKWQQHYFKIPPYVYSGAEIFAGLPGFPCEADIFSIWSASC